MPAGGRKKPFSAKAKKQQLQAKRERQRKAVEEANPESFEGVLSPRSGRGRRKAHDVEGAAAEEGTARPLQGGSPGRGRKLTTIFARESDEEVARRKSDATRPLTYRWAESPYVDGLCAKENDVDIPKRPPWDKSMTPEMLEQREHEAFDRWLHDLQEHYPLGRLNYFEQNIEVWRQLWRVIERSDILIYILDIRFPLIHFGHKLYSYIREEHGKEVVLCLNKCDLVGEEAVQAWLSYFRRILPGARITFFHSNKGGNPGATHSAEDAFRLMETISECAVSRQGRQVPASSFMADYLHALSARDAPDKELEPHLCQRESAGVQGSIPSEEGRGEAEEDEKKMLRRQMQRESYLLLGVIGEPNMGKSTLMNNIFKRKVVSHSSTPGHTKHFQTMFLTPTICFCDSPGVVLPKLDVPRELQVLVGVYPIAQTREPYSAVRYLAERCYPPIQEVYRLSPDYDQDEDDGSQQVEGTWVPSTGKEWSPYRLAEAYALKRGFTTKGGRPDTYRACNRILRDAMNGWKIVMVFMPPDWYETHKDALPPTRCMVELEEQVESEKVDLF